jgi:single-strand DNA-binding protein
MASVNKVMLLGRLGNQPELRYTPSQRAVTELRIATSRKYKNKDEQWTEQTEWHSVVVWGRDAENCERYLKKGREVFIEGRLQTRDWQDAKSGQKRYKTEIVADRVQFIGGRGDDADGGGRGGSQNQGGPSQQSGSSGEGGSDQQGGGAPPSQPEPTSKASDEDVYDADGKIPF